ncbi:hypothetical protein J6590_078695 [Homalodisca vitripennis]|nr:hypothetical protein J6590_078695 [Homalodisca vitripennis]
MLVTLKLSESHFVGQKLSLTAPTVYTHEASTVSYTVAGRQLQLSESYIKHLYLYHPVILHIGQFTVPGITVIASGEYPSPSTEQPVPVLINQVCPPHITVPKTAIATGEYQSLGTGQPGLSSTHHRSQNCNCYRSVHRTSPSKLQLPPVNIGTGTGQPGLSTAHHRSYNCTHLVNQVSYITVPKLLLLPVNIRVPVLVNQVCPPHITVPKTAIATGEYRSLGTGQPGLSSTHHRSYNFYCYRLISEYRYWSTRSVHRTSPFPKLLLLPANIRVPVLVNQICPLHITVPITAIATG